MTTNLARRLDALEAGGPAAANIRVIFIVGLAPADVHPRPLRRVSVLGSTLDRASDESEDAFRDRIEAFVINAGARVALAFQA